MNFQKPVMNSLGFKVLRRNFQSFWVHDIVKNKEPMMMYLLVQFKMAANWHFQPKYGQNTDSNKLRTDKNIEVKFADGTSIITVCK